MQLAKALTLLLLCLAPAYLIAGNHHSHCCQQCGCAEGCQRICRLVCDKKEVVKVTYSCKCEDFCVPCKSHQVKNCDCCSEPSWIPGGAKMRSRKVLVRNEEKEAKPTYKYVVEYLCPQCQAAGKGAAKE
jgi:hypothetical protein